VGDLFPMTYENASSTWATSSPSLQLSPTLVYQSILSNAFLLTTVGMAIFSVTGG